jgi:arginine deiminase
VRIHFLMEQVKAKTINMDFVDTADNTADQLTKPLTGTSFLRGRQALMGPQRVVPI